MNNPNKAGDFIRLLKENEEWLMNRILDYAKKTDFTKYTSTLQEAWRQSISGLTESLIQAVKMYGLNIPDLHPDDNYSEDPVSSFGLLEAKKHRIRGVNLTMFLGLMKYYQQSYLDLIAEQKFVKSQESLINQFIMRCFDRIELGFINEWTEIASDNLRNELEASNREMTNEKNKYLTVFESLYTPIILLDENNRVTNFNLAASVLFSDIKVAGQLYYNGENASDSLKEVDEQIRSFTNEENVDQCLETFIETRIGRRFYRVLLKKITDISEKFKGTIVMLEDMTSYKMTTHKLENSKAQAEEADRLKTAFLANMSHEIRTPMNAIVGFTELMINGSYDETERREYLELIRRSSNDLLNIIEDIIDIAKIESKQLKIKYKPCSPFNMLSDLKIVFDGTLRRLGIHDQVKLILNVDPQDRNIIINSDGERLKQVMSNLLNNAAKFTSEGYIEFGFRRLTPSHLHFFVRDSGPGIPDEMKDRIFERFFQVEDHMERNYGGAGLGLAICKNIVELLGGRIWLESNEGVGSDFYFQLPLRSLPKKEMQDATPVERLEEAGESVDFSEHHILIAEDDDVNYIYVSEILGPTGAKVTRARNGVEAIRYAESLDKLNVILMDIKMPEIDGLEATRYISGVRPEIPVIALTAYAMDGDKKKCLEAGCAGYLTKPVTRELLLKTLMDYLPSTDVARQKSTRTGVRT